ISNSRRHVQRELERDIVSIRGETAAQLLRESKGKLAEGSSGERAEVNLTQIALVHSLRWSAHVRLNRARPPWIGLRRWNVEIDRNMVRDGAEGANQSTLYRRVAARRDGECVIPLGA